MKKIIAISFICGALTLIAAAFVIDKIQEHRYAVNPDLTFESSIARGDLRRTIQEIETYKNVFKRYPPSLRAMRGGVDYVDSAVQDCPATESSDYFYKTDEAGTSYVIFSKGPDCLANTEDDIFPTLMATEANAIGYKGRTDPNSEEINRPFRIAPACRPGT